MATTKTTWSSLQRQFKLLSFFSILILVASNFLAPAQASMGGIQVPENTFSVGFTFSQLGVDEVCSGVLISPTIIVTASHCVYSQNGSKSTNFIFAPPQTELDAPINPETKKPTVVNIFSSTGDIAFIQLDIPLATKGFIRVANTEEVTALKEKLQVQGYGYGKVYETGKPYSSFVRRYPLIWNSDHDSKNTVMLTSESTTACVGDSGGAITAILPTGEEVLIAVMKGAASVVDGCATPVNGVYSMMATVVHPYLELISKVVATPVAQPTQTASPAPKKTKILCVKGKTKKYVYGGNPKCPKGYKKI